MAPLGAGGAGAAIDAGEVAAPLRPAADGGGRGHIGIGADGVQGLAGGDAHAELAREVGGEFDVGARRLRRRGLGRHGVSWLGL